MVPKGLQPSVQPLSQWGLALGVTNHLAIMLVVLFREYIHLWTSWKCHSYNDATLRLVYLGSWRVCKQTCSQIARIFWWFCPRLPWSILLNGRFHVFTAISLGHAQNLSNNYVPVHLTTSLASWNVQLTSPIKLGSLGAVAAEYLQVVVRFGTALLPSLLLTAPGSFVAVLAINDEQILV